MCNAAFAMGMSGAGGVLGFIANMYAGKTNRRLYQAEARIADQAALDTEAAGRQATRQQRVQTNQLVGSQRAGFGASGVDVNVGSALDVQVDTGKMGEMDAQLIKENYDKQAYGQRAQAEILRAQGWAAGKIGMLGATTTLASSVGTVADRYYSMNRSATTPSSAVYSRTPTSSPYNRRKIPNWNF